MMFLIPNYASYQIQPVRLASVIIHFFIVLFLPLWISDTAMDCVFLARLISVSHRLNV